MQVCMPTTPAQMFHLLRRQMHRPMRKPLIVMTPKSLLRHRLATSTLEQMADGRFEVLLDEIDPIDPKQVTRLVLCSGKVYYDILEKRRELELANVAIVRVEQLYPFPQQEIEAELKRYNSAEVYWCQEEPENMGAWRFIGPRIGDVLDHLGRPNLRIRYVGREEAASTATGYLKVHDQQQRSIVEAALAAGETKKVTRKKAS